MMERCSNYQLIRFGQWKVPYCDICAGPLVAAIGGKFGIPVLVIVIVPDMDSLIEAYEDRRILLVLLKEQVKTAPVCALIHTGVDYRVQESTRFRLPEMVASWSNTRGFPEPAARDGPRRAYYLEPERHGMMSEDGKKFLFGNHRPTS